MATKMNAEVAKRIKAMNITASNEEEAREKLLKILNQNGIEGMDEEDTMTLIEIAESFYDGGAAPEEETEEPAAKKSAKETDEELDELAKAAEAEGAEAEDEDSDEEEEESAEQDEFDAMDRSALKKYITNNELEISVKKSMTDDDIRAAIREAIANEATEENQAPAPAPAPEKKPAEKKVATKEKAEKKPADKKISARGTKINPRDNEEDRQHFAEVMKLFPEGDFVYAWLSTSGVTIKHKGANGLRGVVTMENCTLHADGSLKFNLYLLTMTKQTDLLDENDIEYEICWTNAPFIKGITMPEAIDVLSKVQETIIASVTKIDKNLGANREKMEKNLQATTKKAAKK